MFLSLCLVYDECLVMVVIVGCSAVDTLSRTGILFKTHLPHSNTLIFSGKSSDLYEFIVTDDITVVQGCGLGGTSLINANVALNAEPAVFQDPSWPKEIREDMDMLMNTDRQHFVDMIKPTPYPDNYPTLDKMERMKDGLSEFDIEDLDKMFYKTPLYVTFHDTLSNHVGVPQPKCTGCGNCCGGCNVGAKNTLNMNYLPDAKAHGAELFTEVNADPVNKSNSSRLSSSITILNNLLLLNTNK